MTSKPTIPIAKSNTRNIPQADHNYLWKASAGKCAFPDCRTDLVITGTEKDGPATIGEIAHIFAHSTHGPRPNPNGFTEATNTYDNLILLCRNHHRQVDVQQNTYTVNELRSWKKTHEEWVARRLAEEEFSSIDLETIIVWLTDNGDIPSTDFTLRPVDDKIEFNRLSPSIQKLIKIGLMRVE